MLSIFVIFKLHGGWLPFMLVPCCFGDNKCYQLACDTHILLREGVSFFKLVYFKLQVSFAVLGKFFFSSNYSLSHICNSVAMIT